MLMSLLKWQAKILNKLYKTERYEKLVQLQLTNTQQINYQYFFQITPGVNVGHYAKMIESANKVCRMDLRAAVLQQEVAALNQFMKNMMAVSNQSPQLHNPKKPSYAVEHVVIYSSLSKCRIWPKILKSGIGFVPTLIHFYNSFTKQNGDWLDFKFDPVILSQKYTKIMKKVNLRKRDHPKLIQAIKTNNIPQIKSLLQTLQQQHKLKNPPVPNPNPTQPQQPHQQSLPSLPSLLLNNISQKNLSISHISCKYSSLETIKFLHELGVDFQLLDDEKQTALFYAVKRADIGIIRYLVEEVKVDLNHREYQDRTALYLAAFQGDLDIVDYLFKRGADPQLSSKLDRTPLSKACYLGNVKVVEYLLSINVDMLKQDNKGRTALHNAAWGIEGGRDGKRRGHIMLEDSPESAELLIKAGHPVDLEDYDGFTPFFSAVSSNAIRSVYLLISHKANIYHKTKNHETAVFIAAKYGHLQVLKILINEFNLDYLQPDYHGYSPLCASITLESSNVFKYLCDLYMRDNVKIDTKIMVACARQYQTVDNLLYIRDWLRADVQVEGRERRYEYFWRFLPGLVEALKELKNDKVNMKKQLSQISSSKHKQKNLQQLPNSPQLLQKLHQKSSQKLSQILQKQQQDQTQDHDTITPPPPLPKPQTKQIDLITNIQKQLQLIRKLSDVVLEICCEIVVGFGGIGRKGMVKEGKEGKEGMEMGIEGEDLGVVMFLLAECVRLFNKASKSVFTDVVQMMLALAKIINPSSPSIPPVHIPNPNTPLQPPQNPLLLHHHLTQSNHLQIPPTELSTLRITPHQSQPQLIKLLLNKEVTLNLTMNQHQLNNTLFRLAKYRKTGVIIAVFNWKEGIGGVGYQRMLDMVAGKGVGMVGMVGEKGEEKGVGVGEEGLGLIAYCMLHGISDISVYLQQVCKSPQTKLQVTIPQYSIIQKTLTPQQCNIDLEPINPWTLSITQILQKLSQKQQKIYHEYLNSLPNPNPNPNLLPQQPQKQPLSQPPKFHSCKNYNIISTKGQLKQLYKILEEFVLIGIDVEYYEVSKEEYFICSIQISNGEGVYILDTLSYLGEKVGDKGEEGERLGPGEIGEFMREIMGDERKIKIFHAYENDIKWLHEDYDLHLLKPQKQNKMHQAKIHKNTNIVDTSRMYNVCNKVRKGESVGLRTLCQQYLNYEMDKNFQRSDWRIRPLFKQMVQYAALDAEVLPYIYLRMLAHCWEVEAVEKLKEVFCVKRTMKSRGIRNTLLPKNPQQKQPST